MDSFELSENELGDKNVSPWGQVDVFEVFTIDVSVAGLTK